MHCIGPRDPSPSSHRIDEPSKLRRSGARLSALVVLVVAALLIAGLITTTSTFAQGPEPTPDPNLRLATPVMPANPSEADQGRMLYWYHCMPCHGDQGQGLTDEWREVWVEDHQDCWARGCHAGRPGDEGFPIPRVVPAVIGSPAGLANFSGVGDLAEYLQEYHPPQRPGALDISQCRALAVFLFQANGGPAAARSGLPATGWAFAALGACAIGLAGLWLYARLARPGS